MTDQPQSFNPHPLAANWIVLPTDPPNKFVMIVINDASGQRVLFLEPDAAVKIANDIITASRKARSGLVVPGGPLPKLNGNGGQP